MTGFSRISEDSLNDLVRQLARTVKAHPSSILPFVNIQETVAAFLGYIGRESNRLIVVGHASPEIEIAADQAGMTVTEALGFSPFVGHADDALEVITSKSDIVYIANPNTVSGCTYSLKDLDRIAERIPDGKLIVDERFFDFYGISATGLIDKYTHVVVLRSLTTGFGLDADTSGYLVGSRAMVSGFRDIVADHRISKTVYRILTTTLSSEDARSRRLSMIHDESLRVANKLTRLGVQNRITAADFLLVRVADPARVGNFLAKHGLTLTNLDGYPDLKHYMRYRIQSPLSNDNLLDAFRRMPEEFYRLKLLDKRAVLFRKPTDESITSEESRTTANSEIARNRLRDTEKVEV